MQLYKYTAIHLCHHVETSIYCTHKSRTSLSLELIVIIRRLQCVLVARLLKGKIELMALISFSNHTWFPQDYDDDDDDDDEYNNDNKRTRRLHHIFVTVVRVLSDHGRLTD